MTSFTASGMPSPDTVYTISNETFEESRARMADIDLRNKLASEAAYNTDIIHLDSRDSCANCEHNDAYVECEDVRCIRLHHEMPEGSRGMIRSEHILEIDRNPNNTKCKHYSRATWRIAE
jgi:hypothetical protein